MLNYIILGFLNYRPMTGYDIKGLMSDSTSHFWDAKLSQIYATLKKLEEAEFVKSHIEAQDDRPDRRIYTMTEAGKAELNTWLGTMLVNRETKKDPLLLKIFFSSPDSQHELISQLLIQLNLHQEQLRIYQEETPTVIQDFIADQAELSSNVILWGLTNRFGVLYEEMYIQWIREALEALRED